MAIISLVLFQFKEGVGSDLVNEMCQNMLSLLEKCLHPETGRPYIKSFQGGRDNSPEGLQGGLSHAFVMEFENEKDRDFYLNRDPAHLGLAESLDGVLLKATVVDFTPGVF